MTEGCRIRGPNDAPLYERIGLDADAWMSPCGCVLIDHSAKGTNYEFARCADHHALHRVTSYRKCPCLECDARRRFCCWVVAVRKRADFEQMMGGAA